MDGGPHAVDRINGESHRKAFTRNSMPTLVVRDSTAAPGLNESLTSAVGLLSCPFDFKSGSWQVPGLIPQ